MNFTCPPGLTKHQALAMAIRSPQGLRASPNLLKNETGLKN